MEIVRCEKGHFYDADVSKTCPTCANEAGSQPNNFLNTDMFDFGGHNDIPATQPVDQVGATQPINAGPASSPIVEIPEQKTTPIANPVQSQVQGYGATVPVNAYTPPVANGPAAAPAQPQVQGYGATVPVNAFNPNSAAPGFNAPVQQSVFDPVVGWLVCIEGPSKGADFRIRSKYNYIGRASHMDISIPADPYISAERAAIVGYDSKHKVFSFAPGMGSNIVYHNDTMVMGGVMLKAYDVLTVGSTKLLFIPLCGENFDWK